MRPQLPVEMPFGKYKGKHLSEIKTGYLVWILRWMKENDAFVDLQFEVQVELDRRYQRFRRSMEQG